MTKSATAVRAPNSRPVCLWCGKPFTARRGGSRQTFCCARHRIAFHSAARRWAEHAMAAGALTIAELRSGTLESVHAGGERQEPAG